MQSLTDWEHYSFLHTSYTPELTVIFPSREIYFSPALLSRLHFSDSSCPKTLDQWYELFHPEDHAKIMTLENAIDSRENFLSLTRKLYCGDGVFRTFRLDAFILRDSNTKPAKLLGRETGSLSAWLETASDGDTIELTSPNGRVRTLEAVELQGAMTLRDISELQDMQRENITLRREIQKRIFSPMPSGIHEASLSGRSIYLRNVLQENISLALNVLTGHPQLKALRRSLNEPCMTIGLCGLSGSGKTSLMNALIGENLIPPHAQTITSCREGTSRTATIHYQDGRTDSLSGQALTYSAIESVLGSAGVSRIALTVPGALVPEGMCFVDTPGYDSLGGTGIPAIKNILPELDAMIYVTPVRSGLKGADWEFLDMIMQTNTNVIFALSQTDSESDDTEAGSLVRSADAKISGYVQGIRRDMMRMFGVGAEVVPVSAKNALAKFYSRNSPEWQASNIQAFMNYLAEQNPEPYSLALTLRAERTLKILDAALDAKEKKKALTGSSRWRLQEYTQTLRKALQEHRSVQANTNTPDFSTPPKPESGRPRKNLLSSLITSLREHDFRKRFFALDAFHGVRSVILLGADRIQSIRLFSRLAHNLGYESMIDGKADASAWLYSGNDEPFSCEELPVIQDGENYLIAPPDSELGHNFVWQELFAKYTPVVCVDLARIESGLSDISHSPYLTGLAVNDWVLVFGNAGLFGEEHARAITRAQSRVNDFAESGGLRQPEYFIYENYRIF